MTTNIHLHGLDDPLIKSLRDTAASQKVSINKLILDLLRKGLGLSIKRKHHDLDKLAGTWSSQETKTFLRNISAFEHIDED